MRLDERDRCGIDLRVGVRGPEDGGLAATRRLHARPTAAPVVARGGSEDRGVHPVARCQRIRERSQDDHADALAANEAVGVGIAEPAAPLLGQHPAAAVRGGLVRTEDDVRRCRDRDARAAATQLLHGEVHGRKARRASRVDRHARSPQVKRPGDPAAGSGAHAAADHAVDVGCDVGGELALPEVLRVLPDVDGDVPSGGARSS